MTTITETRVERHIVKRNDKDYKFLDNLCFKSKNLYNHTNYILRDEFIKNKKFINYCQLDKILKSDIQYPDYREQPTAQCAQQVLRALCANWRSFFAAIKDWKKNPSKYKNKPNLPKYLHKDKGRFPVIFTNQNCKLVEDHIKFPKTLNGFTIQTKVISNLQQVRIVHKGFCIIIEVIYKVEHEVPKTDKNRSISIDIGLDNLVAVGNNCGLNPFLINGKGLKSINQYYNKKVAHFKSILERVQHVKTSNRLKRLQFKRFTKITDKLHKISKYIINYCVQNNIGQIIIGKNDGWKQSINLGSKTNQNFVSIPFYRFLQMIQYKATSNGIDVVFVNESYTSGTSFLDNEIPNKANYNKTRRKHRGLFVTNTGKYVNADVDAAYQILCKALKVSRNFLRQQSDYRVEGLVLNPVMVTL